MLAEEGFRGKVRVAPSLVFPFCEPRLLELLVELRGEQRVRGEMDGVLNPCQDFGGAWEGQLLCCGIEHACLLCEA